MCCVLKFPKIYIKIGDVGTSYRCIRQKQKVGLHDIFRITKDGYVIVSSISPDKSSKTTTGCYVPNAISTDRQGQHTWMSE